MAAIEEIPHISQVKVVKDGVSWQFNKSVIECNRQMLETGLAADVTFLVSGDKGEVHRFHAHKYVLISRSPVFYSMLCGDLAETGEVKVTDVKQEPFKQMLNYIYTDELDLKPDLVMFILHASKKYLIPELTTKCTHFLKGILDPSNACIILDQSLLFDEGGLANRCMNVIQGHTKAAFASDSFLAINHATLAKILDSDILALPELEVFVGSLKWAKQKCKEMHQKADGINMRKVLGDCVNKFRFLQMKINDFSRVVSNADILSRDEEVQLFRYIADKSLFSAPQGFIDKSRSMTATFDIRTSETIQELLMGMISFDIEIDCNADISIHGLVIGNWRETLSKPAAMPPKLVTTMLSDISINDEICRLHGLFSEVDTVTQDINFNNEVTIKAGQSTININYFNSCGRAEAFHKGKVYLIPKDEITLKDGYIEIKLKSNRSIMPLFGLKFKLV